MAASAAEAACDMLNDGLVDGCPRLLTPQYGNRQNVQCADENQIRSVEGKNSTYVNFVNRGNKTVRTYWINYQGQRIFYSQLEPGESYRQQTYLTHPWVITDSRNNCLGMRMPEPLETTVLIR
jgi:hypothetical protein